MSRWLPPVVLKYADVLRSGRGRPVLHCAGRGRPSLHEAGEDALNYRLIRRAAGDFVAELGRQLVFFAGDGVGKLLIQGAADVVMVA